MPKGAMLYAVTSAFVGISCLLLLGKISLLLPHLLAHWCPVMGTKLASFGRMLHTLWHGMPHWILQAISLACMTSSEFSCITHAGTCGERVLWLAVSDSVPVHSGRGQRTGLLY